jgi:hypothetical protein
MCRRRPSATRVRDGRPGPAGLSGAAPPVVVVVTVRVAALADAGLVVAVPDEVATGRPRWRLTSVTPLDRGSGKAAAVHRWEPDVGRASVGRCGSTVFG